MIEYNPTRIGCLSLKDLHYQQLFAHNLVADPTGNVTLVTEEFTAPFTSGGELTELAYMAIQKNIIRSNDGQHYMTAIEFPHPVNIRAYDFAVELFIKLAYAYSYNSYPTMLDCLNHVARSFRGCPPLDGEDTFKVPYTTAAYERIDTIQAIAMLKAGRILCKLMWDTVQHHRKGGFRGEFHNKITQFCRSSEVSIVEAPLQAALELLRVTGILIKADHLPLYAIELYPYYIPPRQ